MHKDEQMKKKETFKDRRAFSHPKESHNQAVLAMILHKKLQLWSLWLPKKITEVNLNWKK